MLQARSLRHTALHWLLLAAVTVLGAIVTLLPQARVAVAEDSASVAPNLGQALAIMDANPETAGLRPVLDEHGVSVRFIPMAPGIYARYSLARRAVEVDQRWIDADARTLSAVVAHEAQHADDAVSGFLSSGGSVACIESELKAFRLSAIMWTAAWGPAGKPEPLDELEKQLNLIADRFHKDPRGLEMLVRQAYTDQCTSVAAAVNVLDVGE